MSAHRLYVVETVHEGTAWAMKHATDEDEATGDAMTRADALEVLQQHRTKGFDVWDMTPNKPVFRVGDRVRSKCSVGTYEGVVAERSERKDGPTAQGDDGWCYVIHGEWTAGWPTEQDGHVPGEITHRQLWSQSLERA